MVVRPAVDLLVVVEGRVEALGHVLGPPELLEPLVEGRQRRVAQLERLEPRGLARETAYDFSEAPLARYLTIHVIRVDDGAIAELPRRMRRPSLADSLESGNPGIWKSAIPKIQKEIIIRMKIRSAQNVRKVWISTEKNLLALFGAIWAHFLRGPEKSKKWSNFAYFPWWAHGPYSPGLGPFTNLPVQEGWGREWVTESYLLNLLPVRNWHNL